MAEEEEEEDSRTVQTLTEEGVVEVSEKGLTDWLASKEADNRRPAGSGADGRWTVEDEKAAFKQLKKNDDLGTEPYDVLADRLVKAKYFSEGLREETIRKRAAEEHPDFERIDVDKTGTALIHYPDGRVIPWQIFAAENPRSIYDLSSAQEPSYDWKALKGGLFAPPTQLDPLTGKALKVGQTARGIRQDAAKKALDWHETREGATYGDEQNPEALEAEEVLGNRMRLSQWARKRGQKAAEKDEQAEYRADQRLLGTPSYGKSIDNPFGEK